MSKRVLIISYSHLNTDPRVLRQIEALGNNYDIITVGLASSNAASVVQHIALKKYDTFHNSYSYIVRMFISLFYIKARGFLWLKLMKLYERYYWDRFKRKAFKELASLDFSVIIANDADTLPLAVALKQKKKCKILFDAHEYSPLEFEENEKWKKTFSPYFFWLCKKYILEADYCTTVSNGLAQEYEKLTSQKFTLIYNAPDFASLSVKSPDSILKFVHHGAAIPARYLELMIHVFSKLTDKYELHLLLMQNSPTYYQELLTLAKPYSNIKFHEPVPTKQIPNFINQYDIGIFLLPPVNFNYKFALPNKFFEFIQARLMILIGPSPEMAYYVNNYNLGVVTDSFEVDTVVEVIQSLTKEMVLTHKLQANVVARELSGAESMEKIRKIVASLI